MRSVLWRLHAAQSATREGRYEEALDGFVWFLEHAVEYQPSVAAVRLSYGLAHWAELAEVYPKAKTKLEEIRDRKSAALRSGIAGYDVFHDVASINSYLKCEHETYRLFAQLVWAQPALAKRCALFARDAVIQAGDFELASRFMTAPMDELQDWGRHLNGSLLRRKQAKYSTVPRIKTEIDIYAADIKQILAILIGCGRRAEAANFKSLAIKQVQVPSVRAAVRTALEPNARPWYERGTPRR